MAKSPLFSVILTSYNRPQLVVEAIESVQAQTCEDLELILCDDGSNARTRGAIANVLRNECRAKIHFFARKISCLPKNRCRYSQLLNQGIWLSTGKILTYLTDDDFYEPHRLELMARKFQDPEVMICYGRQEIQDWTGKGWKTRKIRPNRGVTSTPANIVDHCSFAHRRECLGKLSQPYWPEGSEHWGGADGVFMSKLAEHWPFHPIDEITDVHRWHPNNIQSRMKRGQSPVYTEEM